MREIGDATALSKLFFNAQKVLPDGVIFTDSEEPLMWLLQDQGICFFVNNSDFLLSSVTVFFAPLSEKSLDGKHSETISAAKAGVIRPYEVCGLFIENHLGRPRHWPWMEVEISIQCTHRTIHLLSAAVESVLPSLPLIYKDFNLPEHIRYVYALS